MTTVGSADQAPLGDLLYARFSVRLRAMVVDVAILVTVFVASTILVDITSSDLLSHILIPGATLAVILYDPLLVSFGGATLGHRATDLPVTDSHTGRRLGLLRALLRSVLKACLGLVSFVFLALTRRHQAFHDLATRSVVVMHVPARAERRHYVVESEFVPPPNVAVGRRIAIIIGYSLLLFTVTVVAVSFAASEACLVEQRCAPVEDTVVNIIFIGLLIGICGAIVLGWRGKLYGARQRKQDESTALKA